MEINLGTLLVYLAVKLLAYAAWCTQLLSLKSQLSSYKKNILGLLLGLFRLLLGVIFGTAIWIIITIAYGLTSFLPTLFLQQLLLYLAVYVPIRWVEWGVIDCLVFCVMSRSLYPFKQLFSGHDKQVRVWRLYGITIACVADLPVIYTLGGLPIGRFFC